MAVFAPAAGANFDFDALLHQAINADGNDDLEHYTIESVVETGLTSPELSGHTPAPPASDHPTPPSPTSKQALSTSSAPGMSRHAPPKPGTNELAYRKARGKAREKLKAQLQRDAAPYGRYAVKPRLVNKHIRKSGPPIRTAFDARNMPHASTAYVGKQDSSGMRRAFELVDLVGDDSEYGFELRRWDG